MKKIVSLFICALLFIGVLPISSFAAVGGGNVVMPMYNNVANVTGRFVIEEGVAKITVGYVGYTNITTSARITTKLQVQTANGWADVNNGEPNNEWLDESTNSVFFITHTREVPSGTYRALITYELYGTGGAADVIEREFEYTH